MIMMLIICNNRHGLQQPMQSWKDQEFTVGFSKRCGLKLIGEVHDGYGHGNSLHRKKWCWIQGSLILRRFDDCSGLLGIEVKPNVFISNSSSLKRQWNSYNVSWRGYLKGCCAVCWDWEEDIGATAHEGNRKSIRGIARIQGQETHPR